MPPEEHMRDHMLGGKGLAYPVTLLGEAMERIELARFAVEVGQRFQFLVDLHGMEGPESSDLLLPSVHYRRPELFIGVYLDSGRDQPGRRIEVSVSVKAAHIYRARLPGLVEAARFAPAHHVSAGRPTLWPPCCAPLTTTQPG